MKATFHRDTDNTKALLSGWQDPERFLPLKVWIKELKEIASDNKASSLSWSMIGRAVMIVNDSKSYCKNIIRQIAIDSGYVLKEVQADKVFELFATGFDNEMEPTIILIPPGIWSGTVKNQSGSSEIKAFQEGFTEMIERIPDNNCLVFVTYVDDARSIVEDLRSAGAFDRRFYVDDATLIDRGQDFVDMLPQSIRGESLTIDLEAVGQVLECEADDARRAKLIAVALKRLAYREVRKVEFTDLIGFALHGTMEYVSNGESKMLKRNIAIHEAGHALVSIIDSDGKNMPDYAGIVPTASTLGQVSASYAYLAALPSVGNYRYKRHLVRVLLAGRAAEQIALGIEDMSVTSARGDLRHATDIAKNLIGRYGMSPSMEMEGTSGKNLLVRTTTDISDAEKYRIEEAARLFLSRQYDYVIELIRKHRQFLEIITENLVINQVLDREGLLALFSQYELSVNESN